jgi:1,4-dihydroxy-2-naphthoate polyprenyltransferase
VPRQLTSTIHCDLEGRITFFSEGAEEIFRYASEEILGRERVSVFSPGLVVLGHVPRWLKKSVSNGHYETDTVFVRKDGSRFAAHIRITPIVNDGVHTGYIGVTTPLSQVSSEDVMPHISVTTKILSWLYVTRAPFLTATIVPVLLGAMAGPWLVAGAELDIVLLSWTILGVSLAHLGANTANDYFDWRSGVDGLNRDYVVPFSGGSRMIQLGVITLQGTLRTSLLLFGAAAAVGAYLASTVGIWGQATVLAVCGAAVGFFYTAPPVRLATRGLGEIGIIVVFGPLLVAGAALVQTGTIEPRILLVGMPVGLLTAAIIWINEFPDAAGDAAGGKRTLVVRIGLERARWGYPLLWVVSYVSVIGLVVMGTLPGQALLGLGTVPVAVYVTRQFFRHFRSRSIKGAMGGTIYLHMATGLLIAFGVWLAI